MNASEPQANFMIQKIYVKDLSFEALNSPTIFTDAWKPQANMDMNTNFEKLTEHHYEVVLKLTITAKMIGITTKTAKTASAGTIKSQPAMAFWRSCCLMPVAILTSQAREEQSPRLQKPIHLSQQPLIEGTIFEAGDRKKHASLEGAQAATSSRRAPGFRLFPLPARPGRSLPGRQRPAGYRYSWCRAQPGSL